MYLIILYFPGKSHQDFFSYENCDKFSNVNFSPYKTTQWAPELLAH